MRITNKKYLFIPFLFLTVLFLFSACLLGDDIETIRERAGGSNNGPNNYTQLASSIWSAEGNLSNFNSINYYTFNVVQGYYYYVFIKDSRSNSVDAYDTSWASIRHAAEYENGDQTYAATSSGYSSSYVQFIANRSGRVIIKVYPMGNNDNYLGRYRIAYTTVIYRPGNE